MTNRLTAKETQALIWCMTLTPMFVGGVTLMAAWLVAYLNS